MLLTAAAGAPMPAQVRPVAQLASVQLAQVTIERRVIIRIPTITMQDKAPETRGQGANPPAPRIQPQPNARPNARIETARGALAAPPPAPLPVLPNARIEAARERKGPKCLKLGDIRGALISLDTGITMVTGEDDFFRVHFSRSCRSADFYASFYIEPNKDGAICAGRDMLHARNGSQCGIEKFSRLEPDD
jgi:hypothetical protein